MRGFLSFAAAIAVMVVINAPAPGQTLGSPDFKPSAEKPVGWRGDWTGRFPGATPPTEWSRRAKGITSEIKYQADKPAGQEPGKDSKPLEYFTIKDWLVAGPFAVDDPAKDIDKDFLGGETTTAPAKDAKAGDSTWKFLRADIDTQSRHECNGGTCGNTNVDFVFAFGKITGSPNPKIEGDFVNKAAYAHTYIWSPADATIQLQMPFSGTAGRFWLNGKPTDLDPKNRGRLFDVALNKGWNRLLVKITVEKALRAKDGDADWASRWLVAAYLTPVGPVTYQTKNVAWMTKMTGRSMSQPIVVGDRVFVGSGISDLMCIDKKTGKVLWMRSNTAYDALLPEAKAAIPGMKDTIEPLIAQLNKLNDELVVAINAGVSPQGLSSAQAGELDAKIKAKTAAERALHDKGKVPPLYRNEVSASNGTPVSDGTYVYWACGGGMGGTAGYVLACFDMDGKRIWSLADASLGTMEHGNHSSLLLMEGKVILAANRTLAAYDAKTGKELWRNTPKDGSNELCITPIPTSLGGVNVVVANRHVHRASDGSVVCPADQINEIFTSTLTPVIENGVIYAPGQFRREGMGFTAVKLPAEAGAGAKCQGLWIAEGKDVTVPLRGRTFMIASPLYVDGLVYFVEMGGGLSAVDPAGKQCVYRLWLDGYNRYSRATYGICASPTMAGKDKSIYIVDDAGFTHILAPGPQFKEVGRNVLENIHVSGSGGNPCRQESFYTSPWFEGESMYLRGEEYLYCIGGN